MGELSERMRNPFGERVHSSLSGVEKWWHRLLCKFADEVEPLEVVVEAAEKLRKKLWLQGVVDEELQNALAALEAGEEKKYTLREIKDKYFPTFTILEVMYPRSWD